MTTDRVTTRTATISRQTTETQIELTLNLDGTGQVSIDTGVGFYDHMLHLLAAHGLFDLTVRAEGDLVIDAHHTVEDVAIAFGRALHEALGDRVGIARMGAAYVPMDEALARVVVDLSGRAYPVFEAEFDGPMLGAMPTSENIVRPWRNVFTRTISPKASGNRSRVRIRLPPRRSTWLAP